MKEKHVILRATCTTGAGDFLGGPLAGPAMLDITGIAVDVDLMDRSRVREVSRHRDVLAVAPAMPITLIQPLDVGSASPASTTVEWGVRAVGADTSPFSGDGTVVAVLDTGIDAAHPAFSGVDVREKNFSDDADGADLHGHGTHCAGTICGRDVSGRRIGVAPGVKKVLIGKVLGANGGSSDQIVQAIQWAVAEGAHVISMSLGMDFPGFQKQMMEQGLPPELATSRALEGYRLNVLLFERLASTVKAMANLAQKPTVIVAAAGNESRTQLNPNFKIAVSPPAVADGVISVAALGQGTSGFEVAPFSNSGASISGPGVRITSAKPGGNLATMSGTSMATPHVAGVAALWAEKLRGTAPLNAGILSVRLLGSAVTTAMKPGFDPADVGGGMVMAPQN